MEITTDL